MSPERAARVVVAGWRNGARARAAGICALCLACVSALALPSSPVQAQPSQTAAAEVLFREGQRALAAGELDTACGKLQESDRLDPAVGTKLNLARCEKLRGRVATAWALYRRVAEDPDAGDDRRSLATREAKALRPTLPEITVVVPEPVPEGAVVRIDGVELGRPSWGSELPVDPGPHVITLRSSRHEESTHEAIARTGEVTPVQLQLGRELPQAAPIGDGDEAMVDGGPSALATAGWVVGAFGLLGLAAGGITGGLTLDAKGTADDHCSDELQLCDEDGRDAADEGRTLGAVTTVALAVGAAAVVTGLVLVLVDEPEPMTGEAGSSSAGCAIGVCTLTLAPFATNQARGGGLLLRATVR